MPTRLLQIRLRGPGGLLLALATVILLMSSAAVFAAEVAPKKARAGKAVTPGEVARPEAVGPRVGENQATPVSRLKIAEGFKIELLYSVPANQGSWVNLCVDPKGRIYASDQYGGLYRFSPPRAGQPLDPASVEAVPAKIRAANGMVWAFGALYVAVNDYDNEMTSGLYRVSDHGLSFWGPV